MDGDSAQKKRFRRLPSWVEGLQNGGFPLPDGRATFKLRSYGISIAGLDRRFQ